MEKENIINREDTYSSLTEKEKEIKDKLLEYIRSRYSSTKIKQKINEDIHELVWEEGRDNDSE